MERIGVGEQQLQQRMARLVPGRRFAVLVREVGGLPFASPENLVARLLEHLLRNAVEILADGEQRGLVQQVREIRAGESGRAARNAGEIRILCELDLRSVQGKYLFAPLERRQIDVYLPVEAAGTQKSGI